MAEFFSHVKQQEGENKQEAGERHDYLCEDSGLRLKFSFIFSKDIPDVLRSIFNM